MGGLSAFAFDSQGLSMTTCQNSKNDYWGTHEPNLFMGPSLYEVYPCTDGAYGRPAWSSNGATEEAADAGGADGCAEAYSTITREGDRCHGDCSLIHSDMLHEAPMCTGIAHEAGAATAGGMRPERMQSGRVYWYLDGLNQMLVRYDLSTGHGPGVLDHRSANIRRYMDVPIQRPWAGPPSKPSHMVVDEASRSLFIAQPEAGTVLRVRTDSGQFRRLAQCVPDECYPSHDEYVEGTCSDGYCTGGACLDSEDGHGCYHIFTETANQFEYELWTCTQYETFGSNLGNPAGVAVGAGHVFVTDFASGDVVVLGGDGTVVQRLP